MPFLFPLSLFLRERQLEFYPLWKSLAAQYAPHFVDVGQSVEAFVMVVIESAFQGHPVHAVLSGKKAQKAGQCHFQSVHPFQKNTEKAFEVAFVHTCAVGCPEKVIDHSLPQEKAQGQGGRQMPLIDAAAVLFY